MTDETMTLDVALQVLADAAEGKHAIGSSMCRVLHDAITRHLSQPAERVMVDFENVGSAGPFSVVDGRLQIPAVTVADMVQMAKRAERGKVLDVPYVYPPKPNPRAWGYLDKSGVEWAAYDVSQMEAYARASIDAERSSPPPAAGVPDAVFQSLKSVFKAFWNVDQVRIACHKDLDVLREWMSYADPKEKP